MKNKLKKFYEENEFAVSLSLVVVGTVTAVTGLVLLKKWDNDPIMGVARGTCENGDMVIRISLQNGKTQDWFWHV